MSWPDIPDDGVDDDLGDDLPDDAVYAVDDGRIKHGEVRNPAGRPKGRRNRSTIIRKVALEKHPLMEKGRRRKRSAVEIVLMVVRSKAAKGDPAGMKLLNGLQRRFSHHETKPPRAVFILSEQMSPEEWQAKYGR